MIIDLLTVYLGFCLALAAIGGLGVVLWLFLGVVFDRREAEPQPFRLEAPPKIDWDFRRELAEWKRFLRTSRPSRPQ